MKKLYIFLTILLTGSSSASYASGIPVYDASGYTQMIAQLNQMSKNYQKQVEQLEESIRQTSAMTGTRNMGSLANSGVEEDLRRYLPNTWKETLNMMNANNLGASALGTRSIYSDLLNTYKPMSGASIMTSEPNGITSKSFDLQNQTTFAAMAAGEQSYNNTAHQTKTYEHLLDELNKTTDLKSSIDLQSRISAENGIVLNELVRLKSIEIGQRSAESTSSLTSTARASTANKFIPDATENIFTNPEE